MRLWVLVFPLALAAQTGGVLPRQNPTTGQNTGQTAPPAAPSAPEDLCTIQGQVFNAVTGEPLKKAHLNLQRTDLTPDVMSLPTSYGTATDASGKFAMK